VEHSHSLDYELQGTCNLQKCTQRVFMQLVFVSHQYQGQQGLYINQKKKKGVWQQMPDMLLMESSGPGESSRATDRWRTTGGSSEVPWYANINTLSFTSSTLAVTQEELSAKRRGTQCQPCRPLPRGHHTAPQCCLPPLWGLFFYFC